MPALIHGTNCMVMHLTEVGTDSILTLMPLSAISFPGTSTCITHVRRSTHLQHLFHSENFDWANLRYRPWSPNRQRSTVSAQSIWLDICTFLVICGSSPSPSSSIVLPVAPRQGIQRVRSCCVSVDGEGYSMRAAFSYPRPLSPNGQSQDARPSPGRPGAVNDERQAASIEYRPTPPRTRLSAPGLSPSLSLSHKVTVQRSTLDSRFSRVALRTPASRRPASQGGRIRPQKLTRGRPPRVHLPSHGRNELGSGRRATPSTVPGSPRGPPPIDDESQPGRAVLQTEGPRVHPEARNPTLRQLSPSA
ncbi:hypothetical protein LXA43DRAFT_575968 [Ganoderma leucocontextum]|nr:hypothetical protein LXA43DRAFT_575968 [Ganoderma leucocontextum]